MSNITSAKFCDICELFFDSMKKLIKHSLTGKRQKRARETIRDLEEAERASPIPPQPKAASPLAPNHNTRLNLSPYPKTWKGCTTPKKMTSFLFLKRFCPQPTKLGLNHKRYSHLGSAAKLSKMI